MRQLVWHGFAGERESIAISARGGVVGVRVAFGVDGWLVRTQSGRVGSRPSQRNTFGEVEGPQPQTNVCNAVESMTHEAEAPQGEAVLARGRTL